MGVHGNTAKKKLWFLCSAGNFFTRKGTLGSEEGFCCSGIAMLFGSWRDKVTNVSPSRNYEL